MFLAPKNKKFLTSLNLKNSRKENPKYLSNTN